jgi:YesN/AraC family two-component response regulator
VTITVLIVDDQAMVRAGFAAVLDAQPGITVLGQAANGQEAVELAHQLRPDVVVMDIRMPVMNGLEATKALQTPPRSSDYIPRVRAGSC